MTRGVYAQGFDSDSLQADVMRFMAIIGFCLVAVFALVRNNDPQPAPPPVSPEVVPEEPTPVARPVVATTTVPESSPTKIEPRPAPQAPPQIETPASPAPDLAPDTTPEPGLSLSFASDRDFLRLLGAGTIELFVVEDSGTPSTLRFDPQRNFVSADAPGEIYELLPETIPAAIVTALSDSVPDAARPTWGVRLPATLERAIAQHRAQHTSGTLLIDRNARIRHVPPA